MAKNEWKGGALLAPLPPTMVSCAMPDGKPNIITVAWTGILATHPPKTYISVRPQRYSYPIIRDSGEFVINLPSAEMIRAADLCGMKTGRKIDKFAVCRLTPEPLDGFVAPAIAEAPLSIFCRVDEIIPLGTHDMFLASIERVLVDNSLLDADGALHMERASLAAYAHGDYFALGKKLGTFGFSVAKKKKRGAPPRPASKK